MFQLEFPSTKRKDDKESRPSRPPFFLVFVGFLLGRYTNCYFTMSLKTAFSAPGKALLAGGYLVLDPLYSAYVVALSARMHAVIQGTPSDVTMITVNSPQFAEGTWEFSTELTGASAYRAKSL
jgi:hypothetical protein